MARVIVNNTRFTPFTFEEMLRPIAMYGQEYRAQEDALSELAIKANVFEGMANEQTDPYAYKMYKKYADDLESQAGQLSREGLSLSSRKNMLQMRERYSKEITPIEVAYKRREELAAEQRKAIAANPTLRYQRMASAMSLDDFIKNPSLDYGESYSGALLTQQVAQAAANYAKVLTEEGGLEKLGLPFQYKSKIRHGASPEEILAVINDAALDGHQGAVNFLRTIRDQVMQSSGVADWADPSTLREFTSFANQGLYSALGQTEIKNYTDQFSMSDALNARQHARAEASRRKAQEEARKNELLRAYRNNTSRLFSHDEIAKANKDTMAEWDKWKKKGYLTKDGRPTKAGWNAVKQQLLYEASGAANSKSPYARARAYSGRDEEFAKWSLANGMRVTLPQKRTGLNSQGEAVYSYTEPVLQGYGNLYNKHLAMQNAIDKGEFATGIANIKVLRNKVSSSETLQNNLINLVTSADTPIYTVGTLGEDGKLKLGNPLSVSAFKKLVKDNPITFLANSPVGNQQFMELSNGQRIFIPKSVFGEELIDPFTSKGDLDRMNAIMRIAPEESDDALAASYNASAYLSSLMDFSTGEDIDYHGSITEEELSSIPFIEEDE